MLATDMGHQACIYIASSNNQQRLFSNMVVEQQLLLLGKVARAPRESVLRSAVFQSGISTSMWPVTDRYIRKRGKPRLEWAAVVHLKAIAAAGGEENLRQAVLSPMCWKYVVRRYIRT